jgi:hypothetical protein
MIPQDLAEHVEFPKKEREEMQALTPGQAAQLLRTASLTNSQCCSKSQWRRAESERVPGVVMEARRLPEGCRHPSACSYLESLQESVLRPAQDQQEPPQHLYAVALLHMLKRA